MEVIQIMIGLLKMIDNDETIEIENKYQDVNHTLLNSVIYLADEYLTNSDNTSLLYIDQIKKAGFDVFPVEQDSFGWLIGGIRMKRGIILFG